MTHFEFCPVCYRLAARLVDQALDMTERIGKGDFPRICDAHIELVFGALSYRSMAQWLNAMLTTAASTDQCPLCSVEQDASITAAEANSAFLCSKHGGIRPDTVETLLRYLARIAAGERFDQERFVLRAALILIASVRGTSAIVRIE